MEKIKKCIKESSVILFSNEDPFELAGNLIENKSPAKAKANQEAPEDIEIQEGPTDLISGPVISEFGALGIPIQINNGKIVIKSSKIIVKKGEIIDKERANEIEKQKIEEVWVRTTLSCETKYGICQACYGYDLGSNKLVAIGTPTGVIAAQSIGEPGKQLTRRTFHW